MMLRSVGSERNADVCSSTERLRRTLWQELMLDFSGYDPPDQMRKSLMRMDLA